MINISDRCVSLQEDNIAQDRTDEKHKHSKSKKNYTLRKLTKSNSISYLVKMYIDRASACDRFRSSVA